MRKALVHGQSGFPMIGSSDDVAQELKRISSAGFDGIGFSFVNYLNELPYFCAGSLAAAAKARRASGTRAVRTSLRAS
jgi:alkanesulfonate monooxygenase SsuD/methylene tetrahydromethanopterin reductase-like flavin-dependent oxidoreductase (luciferase family)